MCLRNSINKTAPLHILTARRHSSCLYLLYFILSIGRRQLAPRWVMAQVGHDTQIIIHTFWAWSTLL